LVIRGGATAGKALDVAGVKLLASVPSKDVLLAQLCGLLMSPISRAAVVLGALAAQKAGSEKAPEAAAETAPEAAPMATESTPEAAPEAAAPAA